MSEDAPVEVSLTQSKDQINKYISDEKLHRKRHNKHAKKRKPKWAKSNKKNKNQKELKASHFKASDFKDETNSNEPAIKKRRLNKWMEESDLFHHINNDKNQQNDNENNAQIDDTQIHSINNNENEIENDNFDEVPQEVIDLFQQAVKESKTEEELEDKWKQIIDEQSKKYEHLRHKLSQFDKVFIEGFQLEVNGINRLNTSALNRALKMKHFSIKNHHRIKFNKKMCYGSSKPSFAFIQNSINNKYDKNKPVKVVSFWGKKIKHMQKASKQDELEKWLEM